MSSGILENINRNLDEKPSLNLPRPSSYGFEDFANTKKKNKVHSSQKMIPTYKKTVFSKEFDKDLLLRIKPKQIIIDKEQLYQENLQLKLKIHSLTEDSLKQKTRIIQLESDLTKKEEVNDKRTYADKTKGTSLIQGLKQTIKELKSEKICREQEIFKLKSNLKGSKVNELEVEVKAFTDECTRLRHHLEEMIKSKEMPNDDIFQYEQALASLKNENMQLFSQLNQMNEENSKIKVLLEEEKKKKKNVVKKVDVNNRTEIQKIKSVLESKEKDFLEKEEKMKNEISNLKNKLDAANVKIKQKPQFLLNFKPKAPKIFKVIAEMIPSKFKTVNDFAGFIKNAKSFASVVEMLQSPKLKLKHFYKLSDYFSIDKVEKFIDVFKEWHPLFDYNYQTESSEDERPTIPTKKILNQSKPIEINTYFTADSPLNINLEKSQTGTEFRNSEKSHPNSRQQDLKKENSPKSPKSIIQRSPIAEQEHNPDDLDATKELENEKSLREAEHELKDSPRAKDPSLEKIVILEPIISQTVEPNEKSTNLKKSPKEKTFVSIKKSDILPILEKFSLSLQIHRIPKSDFKKLLGETKTWKVSELKAFLTSEPFKFEKADADTFSKFLTEPFEEFYSKEIRKASLSHICKKIEKECEDWEIFNEQDEENLDAELQEIVTTHKEEFQELFLEKDFDEKGWISVDEFIDVINTLKVPFSERLLHYCKLLFYSFNMKINSVPYIHFLGSYALMEQSNSDLNDEEIASIIRNYLEKIKERIVKSQHAVKDLFDFDENGLMSYEDFKNNLINLGVNVPDDHLNLIFEALLYEEADFKCISVDDLEEILAHYGSPASEARDKYQQINEHFSEEHENEYSDDYEN